MTGNWKIGAFITASVATVSLCLIVSRPSTAGEVVTDGIANTQFRRTVDPSPRAAYGPVMFRVTDSGGKQTCTVQIKSLTLMDFGIFFGDTLFPNTNSPVSNVAPLNRNNINKGNWSRKLTGENGAPLEFDVANLNDLAGGSLYIATPANSAIVGTVTNLFGCTTNVDFSTGITNLVGCTTNIYTGIPLGAGGTNTVTAILWAPVPPILSNPSEFNYKNKSDLVLPPPPAPSPNAKGTIRVNFNASQGRSVLDVRAEQLTAGQTYTLFIGDTANNPPENLVQVGTMSNNVSGAKQFFIADTKFGDPLPLQSPNVIDLSGHVVQIRDAFDAIHLEGVVP